MLLAAFGGTLFAVVATQSAGGLAAVWEANSPAHTSLLLASHHSVLPWIGMIAFPFTIGLWNTAVSPLAVQRCLGARSEWDARLGAIAAGLLLLVLPGVFVLPGLAVAVKLGPLGNGLATEAAGLRLIESIFGRENPLGAAGQGLVVAALLAAVMNAVSAAVHAVATLWTVDIRQGLLGRNDSESELIARGRRTSLATIVLATLLAPLLLAWDQGVFNFVLELRDHRSACRSGVCGRLFLVWGPRTVRRRYADLRLPGRRGAVVYCGPGRGRARLVEAGSHTGGCDWPGQPGLAGAVHLCHSRQRR